MKLKNLIFLEGAGAYGGNTIGMGAMSSQDSTLIATPGGQNDKDDNWNGIVESSDGKWFLYKEANDWHNKCSFASVTITEGEPTRYRIKIKTKGLRKKGDLNSKLYERVRSHINKVANSWVSEAKKIHNNPELNEIGNPIEKSWTQCFKEALQNPKISSFIEEIQESKLSH